MLSKGLKKVSLLIAVIFVLIGILAGCSDNGSDSPKDTNVVESEKPAESEKPVESEKPAEPIDLKVMLPYWGDMPDTNGPIYKKIEEIMNAKINAEFVLGANFNDKVNVTLASGNLPDILTVNNFTGCFHNFDTVIISAGAWRSIETYVACLIILIAGWPLFSYISEIFSIG